MRYYRNKYELPLWNWLMIQSDGLDLRYLLKKYKKINKKQEKKLYKIFENIVYSLDHINTEVLRCYYRWQTQLMMLKIKEIGKTKNELTEIERVFRDYLNAIQANNKEFEIIEYYFARDWRDKMAKYEPLLPENIYKLCLKLMKDFESIEFYTQDQFNILINQDKYLPILAFTLSPEWRNEFIMSRKIKINNLIDFDIYLYDIYSEYGMYEDYQYVRLNLFDLTRLNSESKDDTSPFENLAMLSKSIGMQIDAKKTTLAEYESYMNVATRDSKDNKPNASGND